MENPYYHTCFQVFNERMNKMAFNSSAMNTLYDGDFIDLSSGSDTESSSEMINDVIFVDAIEDSQNTAVKQRSLLKLPPTSTDGIPLTKNPLLGTLKQQKSVLKVNEEGEQHSIISPSKIMQGEPFDTVANEIVITASPLEVRNKKFPTQEHHDDDDDDVICISDKLKPQTASSVTSNMPKNKSTNSSSIIKPYSKITLNKNNNLQETRKLSYVENKMTTVCNSPKLSLTSTKVILKSTKQVKKILPVSNITKQNSAQPTYKTMKNSSPVVQKLKIDPKSVQTVCTQNKVETASNLNTKSEKRHENMQGAQQAVQLLDSYVLTNLQYPNTQNVALQQPNIQLQQTPVIVNNFANSRMGVQQLQRVNFDTILPTAQLLTPQQNIIVQNVFPEYRATKAPVNKRSEVVCLSDNEPEDYETRIPPTILVQPNSAIVPLNQDVLHNIRQQARLELRKETTSPMKIKEQNMLFNIPKLHSSSCQLKKPIQKEITLPKPQTQTDPLVDVMETASAVATIIPDKASSLQKGNQMIYLLCPVNPEPGKLTQVSEGQLRQVLALVPSNSDFAPVELKETHPLHKDKYVFNVPKVLPINKTATKKKKDPRPNFTSCGYKDVEIEAPARFTPVDITKILNGGKKPVLPRCRLTTLYDSSFPCKGFSRRETQISGCWREMQDILTNENKVLEDLKEKIRMYFETTVIYCDSVDDCFLPEGVKVEVEEAEETTEVAPAICEAISKINEISQVKAKPSDKTAEALSLIKRGLELIQSMTSESVSPERKEKTQSRKRQTPKNDNELGVVKKSKDTLQVVANGEQVKRRRGRKKKNSVNNMEAASSARVTDILNNKDDDLLVVKRIDILNPSGEPVKKRGRKSKFAS